MQNRVAPCARARVGRGQHALHGQQLFTLEAGGIMSGLRAVSAVFAASARLDAEQSCTAEFLHHANAADE